MKHFHFWVIVLAGLAFAGSETELSEAEQAAVDARIDRFYSEPANASLMNESAPKFSVNRNEFILDRPSRLKLKGTQPVNPLLKSAQVKGTAQFQKAYCEKFLKKHFPKIDCNPKANASWALVESGDKAEELADGWTDVTHNLDGIPTEGRADQPLWSDDYWRMRWGLTSFRYSEYNPSHEFAGWKDAVNSYAQPAEWNGLATLPLVDLAKKVVAWSPSEKYDLVFGDTQFTLTNEQKQEGADNLGEDGNVEDWVGICHGWAPASFMVSRPQKPVTFKGSRGVDVEFYPNDIKALFTLAWANGDYPSNGAGLRCNDKKPMLLPNGRIALQDCWDTNPATFHLSLGNMIGRAKKSFVMDKTWDYEVWNQPIVSYEVTYFNPLRPRQRSKNWRDVVVRYDRVFKQRDRFQRPLTRGRNTNRPIFRRSDDSMIHSVVGVTATVVYLVENTPQHFPGVQEDNLERDTFVYDLELVMRNGRLEAEGGEWQNNIHPDFLWVPAPGAVAYDRRVEVPDLNFTGQAEPSPKLAAYAARASKNGYPLCGFMKELIKQSTGVDSYVCR